MRLVTYTLFLGRGEKGVGGCTLEHREIIKVIVLHMRLSRPWSSAFVSRLRCVLAELFATRPLCKLTQVRLPWVFAMQNCEEIKTNRRENPHLAVASSTEVYKCIYYKICILFTALAIIVRETTFTRIDNILIFLKLFEHIHSKNIQQIKNL